MINPLLNRYLKDLIDLASLPEKDWELLVRQAKSANLASLLARNVSKKKIKTPAKVLLHLDSDYLLTSRQIEATRYELEKISSVFNRNEIKLILLKGAAYIALNLEFASHRKLQDIDLLVSKKDIGLAERDLIFYGWVPHQLDDYDEIYYREWMHEIPPMKHRLRGSVIDLHHNIFPPISGVSPDADRLLEQAVFIESLGIWCLSNEDMFIHSAVHFFLQSETHNGLRDLNDMKEMFYIFSEQISEFPFNLIKRAEQLDMLEPVLLAFRYMADVLNINFSNELKNEIYRINLNKFSLVWLDFLYLNTLIPHHSSCLNWRFNLAKFFVFWRGHIKKMPLHILLTHLTRKTIKRFIDAFNGDSKIPYTKL